MEKSFQMLSPFPQTFTNAPAAGDFAFSPPPPPPGSYTALLIADDIDDNDVLPYEDDLPDQKPNFSIAPPETLESLIPPSVLSGHLAIPSFPRKRPHEPIPECSDLWESQQVQIPMLRSPDDFSLTPSTQKASRVGSQSPASPTLESILNGFSLSEFAAALLAPPDNDEGAQARSSRADKGKSKIQRRNDNSRRRRISEKVRCLGKLLPGEQKMSIATILEEANGYIKFLQAQIQALSSMPARSAFGGANLPSGVGGVLGSLSRQQLLEVVVNSPAAQAVLSSEKCCVVSAEQVAMLRNLLKERLSAAGI